MVPVKVNFFSAGVVLVEVHVFFDSVSDEVVRAERDGAARAWLSRFASEGSFVLKQVNHSRLFGF